jgi:hypothetical protein
MNTSHALASSAAAASGVAPSLEAADEDLQADATPRYCPTGLLAHFSLLMAGHGRCVNAAMMLGDREYAMWQLACARAMEDEELDVIAARLFAYFDDQEHQATAVLGTA